MDFEFSVATAPSTRRQRQLAAAVVVATLIAYLVTIPYAAIVLPRLDSFVPTVFAIIFVADLVTAVLLFGQFAAIGSRPLLVLASGYLFSSLIVVGHALTYPGAFAPTGLLGAGPQSAAWLNVWWRLGFAAAMVVYAAQSADAQMGNAAASTRQSAILWSAAAVLVAVCTLVFVATAGQAYLPPLMSGVNQGPLAHDANIIVAVVDLAAFLLMTSTRGKSILNLWLIVTAFAMLSEGTAILFFIPARYTFAFYAIRLIGLPISKVVLVALLWESMRLHANLSIANRELRRERASRLTNAATMVAAITHEIRQPIVGISLMSTAGQRALERAPPDVSAAKKYFGEISDGAFRANGVFDSFLKLFSRGVSDSQRVDLNLVTREAIALLQKELDAQGVTTRTNLARGLPTVRGHPGQLRSIILNLIQNSIDAMAMTTDRPRVIDIATSRGGGGAIALSLRDTGLGFDPSQLASIFDPFVTSKSKGTGLGLAICRMVIDHYGGDLKATSDDGGACFEITLPTGTPPGPARG
ncbi:MAG TPA: MASE4 domain-containing protein [Caulobacteraceae bacterium]